MGKFLIYEESLNSVWHEKQGFKKGQIGKIAGKKEQFLTSIVYLNCELLSEGLNGLMLLTNFFLRRIG